MSQNCSKCFTNINSFNLYKTPYGTGWTPYGIDITGAGPKETQGEKQSLSAALERKTLIQGSWPPSQRASWASRTEWTPRWVSFFEDDSMIVGQPLASHLGLTQQGNAWKMDTRTLVTRKASKWTSILYTHQAPMLVSCKAAPRRCTSTFCWQSQASGRQCWGHSPSYSGRRWVYSVRWDGGSWWWETPSTVKGRDTIVKPNVLREHMQTGC